MKPIFTISAVAVLFVVVPSPCFALWDVLIVSKERAKELGMQVRSSAGPNHVQVVLEFKTEGELKNFSDVAMRLGQGDDLTVSAPLRMDQSKPGRVVVNVTVGRATWKSSI